VSWAVRRGAEVLATGETAAEAKAAYPLERPAYWRACNKGTRAEYYTAVGGDPALVLAPAH